MITIFNLVENKEKCRKKKTKKKKKEYLNKVESGINSHIEVCRENLIAKIK
jgi:protoporphyrinogen oxidase